MNQFFCTFLSLILLSQLAWAQKGVAIREETRPMSKGSYNALVMDLPGTNVKQVEKAWKDYIGTYKGKTSYDKKSSETFTDDAIIKDMSDNTVDIHAKVSETTNGTQLHVWFNLGVTFLSSKDFPKQYPAGEKIVQQFATTVSTDLLESELKEQEKLLKNLEDDLKKLEKDKASEEKEIKSQQEAIKKAQEAISKAQTNIETNQKSQGEKKAEIEAQRKAVEKVKDDLKKIKSGK